METAYYYFFSAVPQVLAGIMALFGVFVLFKLQALSNELSPIVDTIYHSIRFPVQNEPSDVKEIRIKLAKLCSEASNNKSYKPIADYFKTFDNGIFSTYPNYSIFSDRFKAISHVYRDLIERTIFATVFTGCIIVICLILLPFAKFISCNYYIVFTLFAIIIISISIVFYFLFMILIKSLK